MPLDESLYQIPFVGGVDTNTDSKIIEMPRLLVADNVRFDEKTLRKRRGFANLPDLPATATGGATYKNELIAEASTTLSSLSNTLGQWRAQTNRSLAEPYTGGFNFDVKQPFTPGRNVYDFDSKSGQALSGEMITCYAWTEETSFKLGIKLVDDLTGTIIHQETTTFGSQPRDVRVVTSGGSFFVFYAIGTTIEAKYSVIDPFVSFTTVSPLIAVVVAGSTFDAIDATTNAGSPLVAVAVNSGVLSVAMHTFNTTLVLQASGTVVTLSAPAPTSIGLTYKPDPAGNIYHLSWYRTVTTIWTLETFNSAVAPVATLNLTPATPYVTRTSMFIDGALGYFLHTTSTAVGRPIGVVVFNSNLAPTIATAQTVVLRGCIILTGIIKDPFYGLVFIAGYRGLSTVVETIQPTAFVVSLTAAEPNQVRGRFQFGESDDFLVVGGQYIPRVASFYLSAQGVALPRALLPSTQRLEFSFETGRLLDVSQRVVSEIVLESFFLRQRQATEYNDDLFFSGGKPSAYVGIAGFNLFPEQLSAVNVGAGGVITAGTYQYKAYYQHIDANGVVHRSATSPALTHVAAGGGGGPASISVTVPTLRVGPPNDTTIVLTRNTGTGTTVFFVVSSVTAPTYNNPLVDSVVISDTTSNVIADQREPIYTKGGVLDNMPVPAHKYSCVHQRRLFVAGLENPYEIAFSKESVAGEGTGFSEVLTFTVPPTAGVIRGIVSMDDKLIVACDRDFWVITGGGPTPTGDSNGYTEPQQLGLGIGLTGYDNPEFKSMVVFNDGLAFRSRLGLRLITRGLLIHPTWGAEVDDLVVTSIKGAIIQSATKEIKWLVVTGSTSYVLTYSIETGQWSRQTDALLTNGTTTYLLWRSAEASEGDPVLFGNGTELSETLGFGGAISVETAWIKLSGIQGLQRVWHWHLLGEFISNCTLDVSVYTDYNDVTPSETFSCVLNSTVMPNGVLALRHHLAKQKCTAMRFKLSVAASTGGSIALTGMALRAGVRHGSPRLEAGKTF